MIKTPNPINWNETNDSMAFAKTEGILSINHPYLLFCLSFSPKMFLFPFKINL